MPNSWEVLIESSLSRTFHTTYFICTAINIFSNRSSLDICFGPRFAWQTPEPTWMIWENSETSAVKNFFFSFFGGPGRENKFLFLRRTWRPSAVCVSSMLKLTRYALGAVFSLSFCFVPEIFQKRLLSSGHISTSTFPSLFSSLVTSEGFRRRQKKQQCVVQRRWL